MIQLDPQLRIPIYEQLKRKLGELVALGALQKDEQLPSVRVLARDLGVNPNTVQKAYQELEREGVLYSVLGKGSFVAGTEETAAAMRREALDALRTAASDAKLRGVPLEQAQQVLCQTYEEADHDQGD